MTKIQFFHLLIKLPFQQIKKKRREIKSQEEKRKKKK